MSENPRGFGSDNHAGVHPEVMAAMAAVNVGHVHSYGDDPYSAAAIEKFREHFGSQVEVFFAFNGTAANVLSVASINRSFNAVICAESAHVNTDECGAPEKFTGCKLLTVPTENGKLTVEKIEAHVHGRGDEHQVWPKMVSITQATELGTVYRPEEIRELADWVHERGMYLHVDGARLANAAVGLGVGLKEITGDVGVDVLSFGGTKNGLLLGESVVFFSPELAESFLFIRKQGMQLASKMRFIAAQFTALLSDDLWSRCARHANGMARRLAGKVEGISGVEIIQPVEANGVFAKLPKEKIPLLQEEYFFYVWDEERGEVRWMASFDTAEEDVDGFAESIERILKLERGRS
ncbi:MAG: low specificity L-threonine aldolase [Gemmatimonadetes bacterium]|jgi:threonine aldolase|nr:low specificity L-threonine aldolase [Gemmatimonadota bacterium]